MAILYLMCETVDKQVNDKVFTLQEAMTKGSLDSPQEFWIVKILLLLHPWHFGNSQYVFGYMFIPIPYGVFNNIKHTVAAHY